MTYEAVIGLEVHVHLKTKTKAFCGCSTEFGQEPNSQTCPVCLGFPGSLPVLNREVLDCAIKVGLALDCGIQEYTKFDRKNYFYPDLPKNYQISQYDLPVSKDGFLDIDCLNETKRIRIRRVHLEEDAGKLIHKDNASLVDFNRSGMPLLEIVTEPDINSPEEAYEYLLTLKSIIQYLGVSDCDMEKGSLRCDANISLREKGTKGLGTKTELKNMNSFKGVKDGLAYEIKRQTDVLSKGEKIIQETRLWDAETMASVAMRSKEEAQDYRYFPEPDLPPFTITPEKIKELQDTIPELPKERLSRFISSYGMQESDARIIIADKKDSDYAEECLKIYPGRDKKSVVNWLIGAVLAEANLKNSSIAALKIPAGELISLIGYVSEGKISNLTAKAVLKEMIETGKNAGEIIQSKNLIQISDSNTLEKHIEQVIAENVNSVASYRSGKINAIMYLVGQVMKKTQGKANPKLVQEMLKRRLDNA